MPTKTKDPAIILHDYQPGDGTRYRLTLTPPDGDGYRVFAWTNAPKHGRSMVLLSPGDSGVLDGGYVAEKLGLDSERDAWSLTAILTWVAARGYAIAPSEQMDKIRAAWHPAKGK